MKRLEFEDVSHLAETMISMLGDVNDDYPVITAYGNYDVIRELLEELITDGFGINGSIYLEDVDSSGYDKEFALYLTKDGVATYKIFDGDRYFNEFPDIAFVHEECNSKILDYIESKFVYEFGYEEDEDDEYDCANCDLDDCIRCGKLDNEKLSDECVEYSKDEDGDMHGFTVSKSDGNSYLGYSFYTSDKLGMDDIRSLLKEMGF